MIDRNITDTRTFLKLICADAQRKNLDSLPEFLGKLIVTLPVVAHLPYVHPTLESASHSDQELYMPVIF